MDVQFIITISTQTVKYITKKSTHEWLHLEWYNYFVIVLMAYWEIQNPNLDFCIDKRSRLFFFRLVMLVYRSLSYEERINDLLSVTVINIIELCIFLSDYFYSNSSCLIFYVDFETWIKICKDIKINDATT